MTRDRSSGSHLPQDRVLHRTPLRRTELRSQPTARVEAATARRRRRVRRVARQHDALAARLDGRVGHRVRRQQRHRVGVHRLAVKGCGQPRLHDPPQVHHRNLIADVVHDRQVVADEQVRQPELDLQALEEIDWYPSLDRSVSER